MFKFYRLKTGGLCYHVLTFNAQPYRANRLLEGTVVIQHMQGDCYLIPNEKFWDEWEGVEDDDLPPAYRPKDLFTELVETSSPALYGQEN